jgi:hypothetical protein
LVSEQAKSDQQKADLETIKKRLQSLQENLNRFSAVIACPRSEQSEEQRVSPEVDKKEGKEKTEEEEAFRIEED